MQTSQRSISSLSHAETHSNFLWREHPKYTIAQERKSKVVFPADKTIAGRESPGAGSYTPLFGGIGDKLTLQRLRAKRSSSRNKLAATSFDKWPPPARRHRANFRELIDYPEQRNHTQVDEDPPIAFPDQDTKFTTAERFHQDPVNKYKGHL